MAEWECQTQAGYIFKILVEIVSNACNTLCLHVTSGPNPTMYARFTDTQQSVLYDIRLNDMEWIVTPTRDVSFGINAKHLHTVLKSTKKRDMLVFSHRRPEFLSIVCQSDLRESHIDVRTHLPQQLLIDIPPDNVYTSRVSIPSNELQKAMKDLINSPALEVCVCDGHALKLTVHVDGIYTKQTFIKDMHADFSGCDRDRDHDHDAKFVHVDTSSLMQFLKIASLGKQVTVAHGDDLPLKLSVNMNSLGSVDIYVSISK